MTSNTQPNHLPRPWIEATVIGTLWGAWEITVGHLIHLMKIPFGSLVIAGGAAVLILAGLQLFSPKGLALRAGIVCACLKALVPTAGLLTAALAIFLEGALLHLFIRSDKAPGPLKSMVMGVAAAWFVITFGLFSKWVRMGLDFLKLYLALLEKATSWLGLPESYGLAAIALLFLIAALLGLAFGFAGYQLGRAARNEVDARRSRESASR